MARLEDKIAEIADGSLRQAIAEEVAKLKKRTRFGLVYEEHQPEVVPVHGARIKRGERVALRTGSLIDIWRVVSVKEGLAHCERDKDATVRESFPVDQLIKKLMPDKRAVALGKTNLQQGFMWAIRGVAQPTTF